MFFLGMRKPKQKRCMYLLSWVALEAQTSLVNSVFFKGFMETEENRRNTMKNDLEAWQKKANEAQKNYEDSSKQNKSLEIEISELKQQLTQMKYEIESLEIEKKDKYQLQEKLAAAEQEHKELLKRSEKEQGEFSSVESLNETLKEQNLQLHVDLGREKEEKTNLEMKVGAFLFLK